MSDRSLTREPTPADGSLDAAQEQRLADVLEQYVADLEQGRAPSLGDLAESYPELADVLPDYLEGVRLIHNAMEAPAADRSSQKTSTSPAARLGASVDDSDGDEGGNRRQIGDYELVRELGRGGMGIVYEARERSLNRRVALKMLPFAAVLDERQISRFRTEAQAAAGLHHPNIVPVFSVGQERGVHFYAMQYVEGQSLAQAIEELRRVEEPAGDATEKPPAATRRAPPDATTIDANGDRPWSTVGTIRESTYFRTVAQLGVQAAEALEHAHQYGVVHRDIKPSNLLLDQAGKLWVTDFGLARVQSEMSVTLPGDVIGTLRYMSPEQARGRGDLVDGRTDVYALGATLYEMVCLEPAHPGDDYDALSQRIDAHAPSPPRRLNASIPVDLETIILRAMERSRDDRYATAQELADDLRRFLDGRPTAARRPNLVERAGKWFARRRGVALATAAALVLASAVSLTSAVLIAAAGRETAAALAASEASRTLAEEHYQRAREVVDHFGAEVADRLAELPGAERLRRDLMNDTLGYYAEFLETARGDDALTGDIAATHFKSAAIAERLGNRESARDSYRRAVNAWRQEPTGGDRRAFALGLGSLARVEGQLQNNAAAERGFREAIVVARGVLAEASDDPQRMTALAELLANHGLMLRRNGDTEAASVRIRDAIGLLQGAIEINPGDDGALRNLAVANANLSETLRDRSPDEALAACREAHASLARLVAQSPDNDGYRADLAMACNNLAALEGSRGDWPRAAEGYRLAANEIARLVRRSPLVPRHRRELAITQSNLGVTHARLGNHKASDQAFATAAATLEGLIADFPREPMYRSSLSALWNNRGVALRAARRDGEALAAFRRAVEQQERLAARGAAGPADLALLDKQYHNYADALRDANRRPESAAIDAKRAELAAGLRAVSDSSNHNPRAAAGASSE